MIVHRFGGAASESQNDVAMWIGETGGLPSRNMF